MGDIGDSSQGWMPPAAPKALPFGQAHIYPLGDPHAVSVSLPTWDSVIGYSRKEKRVRDNLEWDYPRFHINKAIQNLSEAVLQRLQISDSDTCCMPFFSAAAARRCLEALEADPAYSEGPSVLQNVRFYMPPESCPQGSTRFNWANFSAVLLPPKLWKAATAFWADTGTGLSTRHAEFCLNELDYLDSDSSSQELCTPAPRKRDHRRVVSFFARIQSAATSADDLKVFLAQLATSEQPGEPTVSPDDVFLYPNGMNGIYTISESLCSLEKASNVVAFGWLYCETVKVLRRGSWNVLPYKYGTEEDIDHLEGRLKSGLKIQALFCEIPSNTLLSTINIRRIRALADDYDFAVVCDDTVTGYINLDLIPYVDVMASSLTKTFSGASNVTGGSLVFNPSSCHRLRILQALSAVHEDTFFPLDCEVLRNNSRSLPWRMKRYNENALPLVSLLSSHPSIAKVNHPSTAPTSHNYRSVMRKNGGYGCVLSVVFHSPRSAEHFYDILDVCKGSSFGTNFTMVVPYVQLGNYWKQDKLAKYGIPPHLLRISVGLEDTDQLVATFAKALKGVEEFESQNTLCKEC